MIFNNAGGDRMGWNDYLRRLGLVDKVTLLSVFTKVTDEALTMSSFRPVELEEIITNDMSQSLGDAAAKHATFESMRDFRDCTTKIHGRLAVVPDVGSLIDSIDKLIEDAYAKGVVDGSGKKLYDENTVSGEWS